MANIEGWLKRNGYLPKDNPREITFFVLYTYKEKRKFPLAVFLSSYDAHEWVRENCEDYSGHFDEYNIYYLNGCGRRMSVYLDRDVRNRELWENFLEKNPELQNKELTEKYEACYCSSKE